MTDAMHIRSAWQCEHGVQYGTLAPFNTMVNNLSFETVPTPEVGNTMHSKCEALRFIILDEIVNIGAENLSELEMHMSGAANRKHYSLRCNVNGAMRPRLSEGMNALLCGDWWQLPPIRQVALFNNPSRTPNLSYCFGSESTRFDLVVTCTCTINRRGTCKCIVR